MKTHFPRLTVATLVARLTGLTGCYSADRTAYLPPAPHATWGQLVRERGITFP